MLCITDLYGFKLMFIYMVNSQLLAKYGIRYNLSSTHTIERNKLLKRQFSWNLSYTGKQFLCLS